MFLAFLITPASKQKYITQTYFDIRAAFFLQCASDADGSRDPIAASNADREIYQNSPIQPLDYSYLTLFETEILNVLKCCVFGTRIILTKTAILCQLVTIAFQSEERKQTHEACCEINSDVLAAP